MDKQYRPRCELANALRARSLSGERRNGRDGRLLDSRGDYDGTAEGMSDEADASNALAEEKVETAAHVVDALRDVARCFVDAEIEPQGSNFTLSQFACEIRIERIGWPVPVCAPGGRSRRERNTDAQTGIEFFVGPDDGRWGAGSDLLSPEAGITMTINGAPRLAPSDIRFTLADSTHDWLFNWLRAPPGKQRLRDQLASARRAPIPRPPPAASRTSR